MSQVKFGIETTVYQGFRFLCVTKLYNVSHFAGIPAEPHINARSLPSVSLSMFSHQLEYGEITRYGSLRLLFSLLQFLVLRLLSVNQA
ncbi:MAG: hypothetical protein KME55_31755 [Nostoc indistinguendum CM1-VF10]|jgi:hypothetical protein|nr:hypothetical protein [Nostoc indistinguendum CM1-VF10]